MKIGWHLLGAYRWLELQKFLADYEREQMLWKIRELSAHLGVRLFIVGSEDSSHLNPVN